MVLEVLQPWIIQGGPWVLLSFGVYLVYTGKLVPKSSLDDWKNAYHAETKRNEILVDGMKELLIITKATDEFIKSAKSPPQRGR